MTTYTEITKKPTILDKVRYGLTNGYHVVVFFNYDKTTDMYRDSVRFDPNDNIILVLQNIERLGKQELDETRTYWNTYEITCK